MLCLPYAGFFGGKLVFAQTWPVYFFFIFCMTADSVVPRSRGQGGALSPSPVDENTDRNIILPNVSLMLSPKLFSQMISQEQGYKFCGLLLWFSE